MISNPEGNDSEMITHFLKFPAATAALCYTPPVSLLQVMPYFNFTAGCQALFQGPWHVHTLSLNTHHNPVRRRLLSPFLQRKKLRTAQKSNLPQVIDAVSNEKDMICSLVPEPELFTATLYGLATWYLLYKVTAHILLPPPPFF